MTADELDLTAAIEAVTADTMCAACPIDRECPGCRRDAERWIDEALPHIREALARQIEAQQGIARGGRPVGSLTALERLVQTTYAISARIVRGES